MLKTRVGIFEVLEKKYAKFAGYTYGVAVNSGTSALHLALVALDIKKGDEVIVPDFTMAACGFAVSYTGAKVVTVDCKDNLTIDEELIEKKITKRTKAIMAVHIYGRVCNMKRIREIANKYNLFLIEDTAEAQGKYDALADIACTSFYRNKIIHAEEGGMCVTNIKYLKDRMDYLKNMAFDEKHTFFHEDIGFNYRMPDATALQVIESLRQYKLNSAKRKKIEKLFEKHMPSGLPPRDEVWVYDVIGYVKPDKTFIREFFKPLSTMHMWKQKTGRKALYYATNGFYFAIDPSMTEKDVKRLTSGIPCV